MVGRKLGTPGHEGLTWASNVHLPGIVAETFTDARIVAFSTLCVYPFADVTGPCVFIVEKCFADYADFLNSLRECDSSRGRDLARGFR